MGQKEMEEKEREAIAYIRSNVDLEDTQVVEKLYHKLIKDNYFETQVGMEFLKELKQKRVAQARQSGKKESVKHRSKAQTIEQEQLEKRREAKRRAREAEKREQVRREQKEKRNLRFRVSVMANILLVLVIVAMFVISQTSDNITITNYEEKILDRYEAWEKELQAREAWIVEKEKELGSSASSVTD